MYQFRLSTLLIAVTVLAVYFAIPGMFGISLGAWTIGSICFGMCLWFWKKVLCSNFLLSGDTTGEAVIRLMVGVVATGSLLGNAMLLWMIIAREPPESFNWFALVAIPVMFLYVSFIGGILAGFVVFFVGIMTSLVYVHINSSLTRAGCSAFAGAVAGIICPYIMKFGISMFGGYDEGVHLLSLLVPACFGAIGGGLPELLKIRYDRRLAEEAEANVPRETIGEVD